MRKETDTFIRSLANATNLDFYYVERMLRKFVENEVEERLEEVKTELRKEIESARQSCTDYSTR